VTSSGLPSRSPAAHAGGQQHVEVAVAVQVDELKAVRAESRVRGRVDRFLAKAAAAFVQEGDDRFVLLTDACEPLAARLPQMMPLLVRT
jgi:hypothetical protein